MELVDFGTASRSTYRPAFSGETIRIRDTTFQTYGSDSNYGRALSVIGLGLVRSRKLWADLPNGKRTVGCESHDAITGFPRPLIGTGEMACDGCVHAKWQHRTPPQCTDIWTVPAIIYGMSDDPRRVLIEFTGRSVEPLQQYLVGFRDSKTPLYACTTAIRLEPRSAGNREFAVPAFTRGEGTDASNWAAWSAELASARKQLAPPERVDLEAMRLPGN